jgi:hypothetical protein
MHSMHLRIVYTAYGGCTHSACMPRHLCERYPCSRRDRCFDSTAQLLLRVCSTSIQQLLLQTARVV